MSKVTKFTLLWIWQLPPAKKNTIKRRYCWQIYWTPSISHNDIVSNWGIISNFLFQISANFSDSRYRPWPRVKQFLMDLEPGAFVCDVGQWSSFIESHICLHSIRAKNEDPYNYIRIDIEDLIQSCKISRIHNILLMTLSFIFMDWEIINQSIFRHMLLWIVYLKRLIMKYYALIRA